MAEPFAVDTEDPQGTELAPVPEVAPATPVAAQVSPEDVGLLPNTASVLGPMPHAVMPAPPPPPPSPTEDPRQQLAAIMALAMALGQGVRGGGAGALQGFAETQKALRAD